MPVTLTNLQRVGPLLVPLTSGATLRLAPGQTSDELPDVDVQDNAKIDKLTRQGVLEVTATKSGRGRARAATDTGEREGSE